MPDDKHKVSWSRRSSTIGSCFDKLAKCWANSVLGQRKMDQSWCYNQSNPIFFDRDSHYLEKHKSHMGNCATILENWSMGKKIEFEKHETKLFLLTSESSKFVIETADDQLEKISSWNKSGTVQAKLSARSRLYLLFQSTKSSRRTLYTSSK